MHLDIATLLKNTASSYNLNRSSHAQLVAHSSTTTVLKIQCCTMLPSWMPFLFHSMLEFQKQCNILTFMEVDMHQYSLSLFLKSFHFSIRSNGVTDILISLCFKFLFHCAFQTSLLASALILLYWQESEESHPSSQQLKKRISLSNSLL